MRSQRDISVSDKIMSYRSAKGKVRLMTVIDGIPFYQSTGENSKHPDTWFPFRGIKHTGWIMKPTDKDKDNIPKEVLDQMEELGITDDFVVIKRFGTINTMCISAQIGLGFWKTEKGAQLKSYLEQYYLEYFLSDEILSEIAKQKKDYEPFDDLNEVNKRLNELGSVIPYDCSDSRLFLLHEMSLYKSLSDIPKVEMLFQQLNAAFVMLPKQISAHFSDFVETLHKANLLEYAIKYYMFEDAKQIRMLFRLVQDKKDTIKLSDLERINSLKSYVDKINADKNTETPPAIKLEKYDVRKALQQLARIDGEINNSSIIKQHLELVALLDKHGCLQEHINILDKPLCVKVMLNFPTSIAEETLIEYINLIDVLYQEELLDEQYLDYDDSFYDALNVLNNFNMLNEDTVLFVEDLYNKNILQENMNILRFYYSRLLLAEISKEAMLLSGYSLFSSEATCNLLLELTKDKQLSAKKLSKLNALFEQDDKNIELVALGLAVRYNQSHVLEILLKRDIASQLSGSQLTKLMRIGIKENNLFLIQYALEHAGRPNLKNKFLEMLLINIESEGVILKPIFMEHIAPYLIEQMKHKYVDWMDLLFNIKACLHEKVDTEGNTLLHLAAKEKNIKAGLALLTLGADANIQNAKGQTCRELTNDFGFLSVIERSGQVAQPVESKESAPPVKAFFEAVQTNTTHATEDPALTSSKAPQLPVQKKQ